MDQQPSAVTTSVLSVVLFCYVITQFAASLQYGALNSHALSVKNIALFHAHSLIDFLASYDAQLRCLIAT